MRPIMPAGMPGLRVMSVQVSPPSVDLNRPLPGPPLDIVYSVRNASHIAAKITLGLLRSIQRSTAPVLLSRKRTLRHVAPPSVLLNTPRSAFGTPCWPNAATKTTLCIGRMDANLRNILGLAEADVPPGLAGVGGLVDAVARLDVAADARLARADEDDVRIRFRHGDRAHRRAANLSIRDRRPGFPAIGRLPQTAARGAEIPDVRLTLGAGHRQRSPAAIGPDASPLVGRQQRRVGAYARRRLGGHAVRTRGRPQGERGNGEQRDREQNFTGIAEHGRASSRQG